MRVQSGFAGLVLAAVIGAGQLQGQAGYRYGPGGFRANIIDQVRQDVAQVQSRSRVDRHERDHFRAVQQELADFERRLARGRFEKGPLDRAIDNLNHLVDSDQIDPRGRRILANDRANLRNFRSSGGAGYGPVNRPGGYRR